MDTGGGWGNGSVAGTKCGIRYHLPLLLCLQVTTVSFYYDHYAVSTVAEEYNVGVSGSRPTTVILSFLNSPTVVPDNQQYA